MLDQKDFYTSAKRARKEIRKKLNAELWERSELALIIAKLFGIAMILLYVIGLVVDFKRNISDWIFPLKIYLVCATFSYGYFFIVFNNFYYIKHIHLLLYSLDYWRIRNILHRNEPFALYLRDFESGNENRIYTIGNSGDQQAIVFQTGSKRFSKLTWRFSRSIQIIHFSNDKDITSFYWGNTYYAGENWFEHFKYLANLSHVITLDLRMEETLSKNLASEIQYICSLEKPIALICSSFSAKILFQDFPDLEQRIVNFNATNNFIQSFNGKPFVAYEDVSFTKETKTYLQNLKKEVQSIRQENTKKAKGINSR